MSLGERESRHAATRRWLPAAFAAGVALIVALWVSTSRNSRDSQGTASNPAPAADAGRQLSSEGGGAQRPSDIEAPRPVPTNLLTGGAMLVVKIEEAGLAVN